MANIIGYNILNIQKGYNFYLKQKNYSCISSSSSTFIDNKESYKQISCVEHLYMHSNVFKKHICLLQET